MQMLHKDREEQRAMNANITRACRLLSATALLLAAAIGMHAQELPYTFTVAAEAYAPLPGYLLELPEGQFSTAQLRLPGNDFSLPAFDYLGNTVDSVVAFINGAIALYSQGSWIGQINALLSDHVARSIVVPTDHSSSLGATIDGTAGNRVLKIEYGNLTVPADEPGDGLDSINYQVWLHEATGMIEMRVGPSHVASQPTSFGEPVSGPMVMLVDPMSGSGIYLDGSPAAPTQRDELPASLAGFPGDGVVYRFMKTGSAGVEARQRILGEFSARPNPAASSTTIGFTLQAPARPRLLLCDARGVRYTELLPGLLPAGEHYVHLPTDGLPAGMYFCTLVVDDAYVTRSLLVW